MVEVMPDSMATSSTGLTMVATFARAPVSCMAAELSSARLEDGCRVTVSEELVLEDETTVAYRKSWEPDGKLPLQVCIGND
ncbi:hypothetical protein DV515_00014249 [Chloebia gouldiae]|uniref:Uncharacterized protein n=1 Tax=Chloebia gouldiae TaxID=44316 RepID=A0A3L8RYK8_CHLGU|nr:hypothetical protein DV515_00014249 [Chloebia gouldiae]